MKNLLRYLIFAWLAATACTLFACSDSDSLLYNEEDGIYLQVHAEMAITYELDSARVRADTIWTPLFLSAKSVPHGRPATASTTGP